MNGLIIIGVIVVFLFYLLRFALTIRPVEKNTMKKKTLSDAKLRVGIFCGFVENAVVVNDELLMSLALYFSLFFAHCLAGRESESIFYFLLLTC